MDDFIAAMIGERAGALRAAPGQIVRSGDAVTVVSWRRQPVTRLPFTDNLPALDATLAKIEKESAFVLSDERAQSDLDRKMLDEAVAFAAVAPLTRRFAPPSPR